MKLTLQETLKQERLVVAARPKPKSVWQRFLVPVEPHATAGPDCALRSHHHSSDSP